MAAENPAVGEMAGAEPDAAVQLRFATADDAEALAWLSQELLAFYGLASRYQRSYMSHAIANGAFAANSGLEILVAEADGTLLAFLAFSSSFALANCQQSFFIQDLFVSTSARGQGTGGDLMRALVALAEDRGVTQIDWTTDPWNDPAIGFYEGLGDLLKSDKVFYRLAGEKLLRYIRKVKQSIEN